jgi:hypothetical protein
MQRDPAFYLRERQILWAKRHEMALCGSALVRGRLAYTRSLDENLFEALMPEVRAEYEHGDGRELGRPDGLPGKMQAVHSSSAIACNVFHYWRRLGRPDLIASACGLSVNQAATITFEQQLPIDLRFRYAPNLDVLLTDEHGEVNLCGIEAKFTEPYSSRECSALSPKYLDDSLGTLWHGLSNLRALANQISVVNRDFEHLDAGQLIKHILGLEKAAGRGRYRLVYLWYDVVGPQGAKHNQEIEKFSTMASEDGVSFSAVTYQDLILALALTHRHEHGAYVDYIVERYL